MLCSSSTPVNPNRASRNGIGFPCRGVISIQGPQSMGSSPEAVTLMASGLWQGNVPDDGRESPVIDTSVPHVARVYDYWVGGHSNYAVDREAGDEAIRAYPDMRSSVRANRA